jgi:hypothetical protein
MNKSILSKRLLRYVSVPLVVVLVLYMVWGFINGRGLGNVCAGISLLLAIGAILYLKQMENRAEKNVAQRIRAEFSPESQAQVFEIYEHLKLKELEGLFLKILDDANGDVIKVKNLATVAESVGWKAFLENRW